VAQPLGLNFRVAAPSRFFEGAEGVVFPLHVYTSVDGIDADQPALGIRVEGKTAPEPVLREVNPRPFKTERVGHPERPTQSLGVDVPEWYHLDVIRRQEKHWGRVGHPPNRHLCTSDGSSPASTRALFTPAGGSNESFRSHFQENLDMCGPQTYRSSQRRHIIPRGDRSETFRSRAATEPEDRTRESKNSRTYEPSGFFNREAIPRSSFR
jgi:hypothetical protein